MDHHARPRATSGGGDAVDSGAMERVLGDATALAEALASPAQVPKTPPCAVGCAVGGDVRGWIGVIAQRRKLGLSDREAYSRAWRMLTDRNPFPATLGRICPHPCEAGCNRAGKDGAVAINALERFLGDWGLSQHLALQAGEEGPQPESIGVVGAGPAGLSFAHQMARRGYRVTVYEKQDKAGGMLYYGIPQYRLPEDVLDAEVRRVLALGVELELGTVVGRDVTVRELRDRHAALFLGIGAGRGLRLDIPGEEGSGVWTGTQYLGALNRGECVPLGGRVIVVGGGNTAMDAARCARRSGAGVTLLYRRSATEMPAITSEVEAAADEGVKIHYLVAPVRIERRDGAVCAVVARRMRLAEPDESGRRRCVPVDESEFELPADSVIAAVSQEVDWSGLEGIDLRGRDGLPRGAPSATEVLAGGDALGPGIAGLAIAQGRFAAEALHAQLRGLPHPAPAAPPAVVTLSSVKADFYAGKERASVPSRSVPERLSHPDAEVEQTLDEEAFLGEVARCFSCGLCFGCEHCFTYCNGGGFVRLEQPQPGAYFALRLDSCEACRKCIEICPCGFLSAIDRVAPDTAR